MANKHQTADYLSKVIAQALFGDECNDKADQIKAIIIDAFVMPRIRTINRHKNSDPIATAQLASALLGHIESVNTSNRNAVGSRGGRPVEKIGVYIGTSVVLAIVEREIGHTNYIALLRLASDLGAEVKQFGTCRSYFWRGMDIDQWKRHLTKSTTHSNPT
jgi:hypothetical protein